MSEKMTAPKVKRYISWLGDIRYREYGCVFTYDDKAYEDINAIFEVLKKVKPSLRGYIWHLWLPVERGSLEDFADPNNEDDLDCYGAKDRDELETVWKEYFPHEIVWYPFSATDDTEVDYRGIFLGNRHVIEVDNRKTEKSYPNDISEFTGWLLDAVKGVVAALEADTYNERVNKELPPELKTGTILRKDFYDLFPTLKERFLNGMTQAEIDEFIEYANAQPEKSEALAGHRISITANDFFNACAIAYKANDYKDCSRTPIDQYKGNADGRDEGLTEIDPDSAVAFEKWYESDRLGGHPWEIYPGGNSTHIDLAVARDKRGFYFSLAGKSEGRCIEAIRIYLALKHADLPVYLWDAKQLVKRLLGTELIGIVPQGIIPRYCESMFPSEDVIDFMNLPYEEDDVKKMLPFIKWQDLEKTELV